jgi:cell division protein FtsL
MKRPSRFLFLMTLVAAAGVAAFSVHLALRGRAFELGYELGQSHSTLATLRESKRVLELELTSHKTPERVSLVARSLLGMQPPRPERMFSAGPMPAGEKEQLGALAPELEQASPKEPGP